MVNVTIIKTEDNQHMGFRACGHAGMADNGQDIVCAAVSILLINTVNAIEKFTEDPCSTVSDEQDGEIEFLLKSRPSQEANLLLRTMVLGLRAIFDDYEEYINLSFEEV